MQRRIAMKFHHYKCLTCGSDDFDIKPIAKSKEVIVVCKNCEETLHTMNRQERRDLNRMLIANAKKRNKNIISQIRKGEGR